MNGSKCFECSASRGITRKFSWMVGKFRGHVRGQCGFDVVLCDECHGSINYDQLTDGKVWGEDWYYAYHFLKGERYLRSMDEVYWKCHHCDSTSNVRSRSFPWTVRARSRDGGGVLHETELDVYLCQECWNVIRYQNADGWDEYEAWDWLSYKLDDSGRSGKYTSFAAPSKTGGLGLCSVKNDITADQMPIMSQPRNIN